MRMRRWRPEPSPRAMHTPGNSSCARTCPSASVMRKAVPSTATFGVVCGAADEGSPAAKAARIIRPVAAERLIGLAYRWQRHRLDDDAVQLIELRTGRRQRVDGERVADERVAYEHVGGEHGARRADAGKKNGRSDGCPGDRRMI